MSSDVPPIGQQWRAYHWLGVVPAIGMLGGIPFANRVHPFVLGLPFLLAWLVGWVIATAAIMGLIFLLDGTHNAAEAGVSGDA